MLMKQRSQDHFTLGLMFAIGSAFAFGMSGPFAKSLMAAGWSPTAAVTARLAGGALLMIGYAGIVRPGWLREAAQHGRIVALYGMVPIAGAQLFYFNAVDHLSVGVALLLEYTAPILVVGYLWASTRRRPTNRTLAGIGLAITGIMLVLNVFGGAGAQINAIGVAWGLAAAVCAACYFMMSDEVAADGNGLHPVTLATGGLVIGTISVAVLGLSGVMPLRFTTNDAVIAGLETSWVVPVVGLALIPTAIAYTFGIMGIARLRPSFASLVGLTEVMFAVLAAWVLLGEAVTGIQVIGGAVVLVGLALARNGEHRSDTLAQETWPDGPVAAKSPGTVTVRPSEPNM